MMNTYCMFDMQIYMFLRYKLDKSHKNFQINNVNYHTMNILYIQKNNLYFQYHLNKSTCIQFLPHKNFHLNNVN